MRAYRTHRRQPAQTTLRPLITFLLVASFGILFAGCSAAEPENEFVFTADDAARFRALAEQAEGSGALSEGEGGSGIVLTALSGSGGLSGPAPVLDLSMVPVYTAMRSGPGATGENLYRVINDFLNMRAAPGSNAALVVRLNRGALLTLLDFTDASWAKVKTADGREGFVSTRYIAKVTSEQKLAEEKKKFDGLYYVNFAFLNVRKEPAANSDKIGELAGQSFVRPQSIDGAWATVPFGSSVGYVSSQYLAPFQPPFYVRQETFTLPVLHYRYSVGMDSALQSHIQKLKENGVSILSFKGFRDLLIQQEEKDVRTPPSGVLLAISGVTAENAKTISDLLTRNGVSASLFLQTKNLGLSGITQKTLQTMLANGLDVQVEGHTGDDLRSLTNAQLELELKQSRQLLEEAAGTPVFAVLYPQGGVNDRVMQVAQESGYLLGVGAAPDRSFTRDQLLRLPSFQISSGVSADEVLKIAKGQ